MKASARSIPALAAPFHFSVALPQMLAAGLLLASSIQAALRLEIDGSRIASMENINSGGDAWPRLFTSSGGQLYFVADDSTHGPALRRFNGTTIEIAANPNPLPSPADSQ